MEFGKKTIIAGTVALLLAGGGFAALAQGMRHHDLYGPMGRMCDAKDPLAPRLIERLQRTIKPTDAQKAEFEALKAALSSAEATVKATCPTDPATVDHTPPALFSNLEQHLTAMLSAVKTVRPAFETLYAKLDDKQRDALRWSAPFGWEHHHKASEMMGGAPKAQ
jgi:hypothetical protein